MYKQIEQVKKLIKEANAVLITAGAGMGVDSGLPDFRGNEGFWKEYLVIQNLGISFRDMANPQWFESNPALAWAFYGHSHDGFKMLFDLVQKKNNDYFIYTSNVDGQFQKAGFDKNKIVEVHGSIHHFQCGEDCHREIWDVDKEVVDVDIDKFIARNTSLYKDCEKIENVK